LLSVFIVVFVVVSDVLVVFVVEVVVQFLAFVVELIGEAVRMFNSGTTRQVVAGSRK
jgi:hypothetical protein